MSTVAVAPFTPKDGESIKLRIAETLQTGRIFSVVEDADDYERAAGYVRSLADLARAIEDYWKDDVAAAHRLHKSLTTKRQQDLGVVTQERSRVQRLMLTWQQEAERQRRAEEARLAEEERQRQEALALEQAAAFEAQGQRELAAAVIEEATQAPAPMVSLPPTPKVEGVATVERWDFEVVDPDQVPREFCAPDPRLIRLRVQAMKSRTAIPGVRVFRADTMRVARR